MRKITAGVIRRPKNDNRLFSSKSQKNNCFLCKFYNQGETYPASIFNWNSGVGWTFKSSNEGRAGSGPEAEMEGSLSAGTRAKFAGGVGSSPIPGGGFCKGRRPAFSKAFISAASSTLLYISCHWKIHKERVYFAEFFYESMLLEKLLGQCNAIFLVLNLLYIWYTRSRRAPNPLSAARYKVWNMKFLYFIQTVIVITYPLDYRFSSFIKGVMGKHTLLSRRTLGARMEVFARVLLYEIEKERKLRNNACWYWNNLSTLRY